MFKQPKRPPPDFRILKLRAAEEANKSMTDYIKVSVLWCGVESLRASPQGSNFLGWGGLLANRTAPTPLTLARGGLDDVVMLVC